jgi:hypothetical protein
VTKLPSRRQVLGKIVPNMRKKLPILNAGSSSYGLIWIGIKFAQIGESREKQGTFLK